MRIRFLDSCVTSEGLFGVGQVCDLSDEMAAGFIAAGHARRVPAEVEEATAPPAPPAEVEEATAPPAPPAEVEEATAPPAPEAAVTRKKGRS